MSVLVFTVSSNVTPRISNRFTKCASHVRSLLPSFLPSLSLALPSALPFYLSHFSGWQPRHYFKRIRICARANSLPWLGVLTFRLIPTTFWNIKQNRMDVPLQRYLSKASKLANSRTASNNGLKFWIRLGLLGYPPPPLSRSPSNPV